MEQQEPLSSEEYDETWLRSAWGNSANQSLLAGDPIASRPRMSRAIELAALSPGLKLLDIACGRGEFPVIASYLGVRATGIDFSHDVLKFANRVRQAHIRHLPGLGSISLIQADAAFLPFQDELFDRITLLDIIEHLTPQQLEAMFIEVKRVLKPEGFAVIHTLPNRWVYDIAFPILNKLSSRFPKDPRGPFEQRIHINEQDLPGLHRTLEKCGIKNHLWLEQHMAAQARWNSGTDEYGDNRDDVYPILAGPAGRILELLSMTPLKLILSNDIFGVLWKSNHRPKEAKVKFCPIEKLAVQLL